MRDAHDEVRSGGADVVAIGTGDLRYAHAFVEDERIPFLVLVDDDARAARAASVRRATPWGLFDPRSFPGARRARRGGHRIRKSGKRVTQLGATFVVGPGSRLRYEHLDEHTADHAPVSDVIAAAASDR